jgi:predicted ATPase
MMNDPEYGAAHCVCRATSHQARLVVLTGGPGGGKTALLELARRVLCEHVALLPEAASVVYGGGFPRRDVQPNRRAAQRAIFAVQRELERDEVEQGGAGLVVCDRGTVDAVAYWPGDVGEFWRDVGSSVAIEMARYAAVIHMRTPPASEYNHRNPLRTESAAEAARIDARIEEAWRAHPRRFIIDHRPDFFEKASQAMRIIRAEVPLCCRR